MANASDTTSIEKGGAGEAGNADDVRKALAQRAEKIRERAVHSGVSGATLELRRCIIDLTELLIEALGEKRSEASPKGVNGPNAYMPGHVQIQPGNNLHVQPQGAGTVIVDAQKLTKPNDVIVRDAPHVKITKAQPAIGGGGGVPSGGVVQIGAPGEIIDTDSAGNRKFEGPFVAVSEAPKVLPTTNANGQS